ncbi:MAG: hypothetical protein ACFFCW_25740 [Candidatus Hodarchaeota archaeon]
MDRCTNCILPESYPGITFNKEGVCRYCTEHEEKEYVGIERFLKEMRAFLRGKKDRNKDYDCMLGFSGGRDSTYLLYYLTKKLNLKVLAYSVDHGYVPEQTRLNMKRTTDILNVKLVVEKHNYLKKNLKHVISSWITRPSLPRIEMFCTGCKLGIENGTLNYAKKNKIPGVVWGETNFEYNDYRFNLMKINPNAGTNSMILGVLSCYVKNPKWLLSPTYLITQIKDYLYFFNVEKNFQKRGLMRFDPLLNNLRWVEKDVTSVIKNKLGWSRNPKSISTWRGDCTIALLKLYTYYEILGFNDKVVNLSYLIRDHQINREEALERLEKEEKIPDNIVKDILNDFGLDFFDFEEAVKKARKNYSMGIIR